MRAAMRATKRVWATVAVVAALLAVSSPAGADGQNIYVDVAAAGANDGSSWSDAFTDLQDALAAAAAGDEIRVAEGTHRPHASDRTVSFVLVDGVDLIGGYPTGGAASADPVANPTILSGDLNGDDVDGAAIAENSFHVVAADATIIAGVTVDGVTITAGNADGAGSDGLGGGIRLDGSTNISFVRSTITANTAIIAGGMAVDYATNLTLSDVVVSNNTSLTTSWPNDVGGIRAIASELTLVDAKIIDNIGDGLQMREGTASRALDFVADVVPTNDGDVAALFELDNDGIEDALTSAALADGALFEVAVPSVTMTGAEISRNTSEGVSASGSVSFAIDRSELADNGHSGLATALGRTDPGFSIIESVVSRNGVHGVFLSDNSGVVIDGSTLSDNVGAGLRGIDSGVLLFDTTVSGNSGSGIRGSSTGIDVISSRVVGNSTAGGGGGIWAGFWDTSIVNSLIAGNVAAGDGGGVALVGQFPVIVNSLIVDNTSGGNGGGVHFSAGGAVAMIGTTIAGNTAAAGGGMDFTAGGADVANSIVWGNSPAGGGIMGADASTTVNYSDVKGWTGAGTGNIDLDPMFLGAGDYRLRAGSPALDAGDDAAVAIDVFDADNDGDMTEPTPDFDLQDRIWGTAVDMGAYEFVPPPVAAAGVVAVTEGDNGSTVAEVLLSLSWPTASVVTVDWSTLDWTATSPDDFVAASGTVTFAPGETAKTVPVTVNSDELYESDEAMAVTFTNPTNATVGGFMGLGLVIINDDDPQPTVSAGGIVANPEGDTGSTVWNLPVMLSAPAGVPISIDWNTLDNASNPSVAHPGTDYVADSGTITFLPGETTKDIPIEILGDTIDEPPLLYGEWGLVQLTNPTNTTVTGGLFGLGLFIIIDDD